MSFRTYPPCAALRPYVQALAVQTTQVALSYPVLPTTGLVLGFQYRGALACHAGGSYTPLAPAGITGICSQVRVFAPQPPTATVLVLFKEGGAAPFFRLPLHELFEHSVALENLVPPAELARTQEALHDAATDAERLGLVEAFLLARYQPTAPDGLVQAALQALHHTHGTVRIAALARQLGTSASPLEKRFRQVVGASPKKIATIVQLTHALRQHQPGQSLTELGYAAGFYDQAHFIHAFQELTGQSPRVYFEASPMGEVTPLGLTQPGSLTSREAATCW